MTVAVHRRRREVTPAPRPAAGSPLTLKSFHRRGQPRRGHRRRVGHLDLHPAWQTQHNHGRIRTHHSRNERHRSGSSLPATTASMAPFFQLLAPPTEALDVHSLLVSKLRQRQTALLPRRQHRLRVFLSPPRSTRLVNSPAPYSVPCLLIRRSLPRLRASVGTHPGGGLADGHSADVESFLLDLGRKGARRARAT